MKVLTVMVLLVAFQMSAQSLTEKNLLGKWQVSSMEASGILIDYDKKEITLPEEMKSVMSGEDVENMKKDAFAEMEAKGFYGLEYTSGNIVSFVDGDNHKDSPYTLLQKDGKQFMEGGPIPGAAEISIAGDKLTLRYETGPITMTFKKVN